MHTKMNLRMLKEDVYGSQPRPLVRNQLPTWRDVGLALDELIKNDNLDTSSAVKEVTGQIVDIYESVLIPTINEKMSEGVGDR